MTIFSVVDTETTGVDPQNDAMVEIARVPVSDAGRVGWPEVSLIKPPMPIPPEASAVHHITDDDVVNAPSARDIVPAILATEEPTIYVAHNAKFERGFLEPFIPGAQWICTYKAALRVWPEAPNHKNQTLRYALGLRIDKEFADPPHRARSDAYVTASIFGELLRLTTVEDMLRWTDEPALLPTCPIGDEWRGKKWIDVDRGFLEWIIKKIDDNPDLVWNAKHELERRDKEIAEQQARLVKMKRETYVAGAVRAIQVTQVTSAQDIRDWFKLQRDGRREDNTPSYFDVHGIKKDSDEYNKIVKACADRVAEIEGKKTEPQREAA